MPSLTIPERYRKGLAAIGSLPEDVYAGFLSALKKAAHAETASALAQKIEKDVPAFSRGDLTAMISALAASQEVKQSAHVEIGEFVSDTLEALCEDSPDLMGVIDQEQLKSRLFSLISETDIHLTALRVRGLRSEVERLFCGARILTDIRAAFEDDASKPPSGATILQTLEIKYHDDLGRHREFYVSLDENDLAILRDAVERAEKKRDSLKRLLAKADIKTFE